RGVGGLAERDEPAELKSDGVRLRQWPSVRVSLDRALAFRPAPDAEGWTAWVDLTCMYNTELPFTAARTHVIGLGAGRAEAIADAVASWKTGVAPALISYIYGYLKADADTWPADDMRGVAGWSCITGPYVLRSDGAAGNALATFLQQNPMIGAVRDHLAVALDRTVPFHTVSLYRAQTEAGTFADVLIDNVQDPLAGERLKEMRWPDAVAAAR